MRQYGLATPTMAQYAGETGPDVDIIDEDESSETFGEVIGTTPGTVTFDPAKQAAFDDYQDQYQFRLSNRPMYESAQFRTTPTQQQPQTYEDMFQMYLGRDPVGDGELATINRIGSDPLSDAQRQQFLRQYENEFADLGIRNTGNQLVSDQIGNYYGNILRNPDFNDSSMVSPTNPIDPSAPFIERNPTVVNPNPPFTGTIMTTDQAYYDPDNPPVVDGEVSQTFLDFANQQDIINANLNNPLPTTGYSDAEARNIDPMSLGSNAQPTWANYLGRNQDVYAHANRVADAAGVLPGPDRPAFLANIAKEHFVDYGREEGRSWYNRGGEVKGYQLGGGYAPFGVSEKDAIGVTSDVGLSDGTETIVEEKIETVPNYQDTKQMVGLLLDAAPTLDKSLTDQRLAAQTAFTQEQSDFNDLIKNIVAKREKGPDKAELYFRLASAFAQPTKSKSFGFLENVPTVLADFAKDSRKAETKAQDLELSLAKTKMAQAQAKYNRIEDKQSSQAKSYREYMLKVFESLSKNNQKAMELFLKTGKEKFAQSQLSSGALAQKIKDEDSLLAFEEGLKKLAYVKKVNERAGGYTDLDSALERIGLEGGTLTEQQLATREVRQVLKEFSISQLKATFGAQLSDSEREVFFEVFGAGTIDSAEERARLIDRVIREVKAKENLRIKRLAQINSGEYQSLTPKSKD